MKVTDSGTHTSCVQKLNDNITSFVFQDFQIQNTTFKGCQLISKDFPGAVFASVPFTQH